MDATGRPPKSISPVGVIHCSMYAVSCMMGLQGTCNQCSGVVGEAPAFAAVVVHLSSVGAAVLCICCTCQVKDVGRPDSAVDVLMCFLVELHFDGEAFDVTLSCGDVRNRHLPLPQADAQSKQQQEGAIEELLQELDIDLLVLAR